MSKNWSKEDKSAWANSEVMQELEKQVTRNIKSLHDVANNIANKSAEMDVNQVKQMEGAVDGLTDSIRSYDDAKGQAGLVDDGVTSSDLLDEPDETNDASDEDIDVRGSVVSELRELAKSAIDKNNMKLAYRIERTIEEILGV
tara:strand:+ start:5181 stop:5609 length:429 start_codon:yes stop_codon:yes gene_type:complete